MSTQAGSPSPKSRSRSPVEIIVVWGGILLLGVLAYAEWQSRSAYQEKYAKLEEINDKAELTETDVNSLLADRTPQIFDDLSNRKRPVGAKRLAVYSWFTVNPFSKRELYVYYGVKNERKKDDVASVILFAPTEYNEPEAKPVAVDPTQKPEGGPVVDFSKRMGGGPRSAEDQKKVVEGYLKFAPPGFRPPGTENVAGGDKKEEGDKASDGDANEGDGKPKEAPKTDEEPGGKAEEPKDE